MLALVASLQLLCLFRIRIVYSAFKYHLTCFFISFKAQPIISINLVDGGFLAPRVERTWYCSLQVPPEGAVYRHRHPPRGRRGGGLLHHRPGHDSLLPQVRGVLPWHGRPEGKSYVYMPGMQEIHSPNQKLVVLQKVV